MTRGPHDVLSDPVRLEAVRATRMLDSPPEQEFDRLTRLAARLTGAPVTFISVVDEHRDFYKSCFGFPEPLASERQISGTTFCHFAIRTSEPLVISDTLADEGYRDVPTVKTLGVRAYLGVPLMTTNGEAIGSFCAIDFVPHAWTETDVEVLRELGASTLREIELRLAVDTALAAQKALDAERNQLRVLLEQIPAGVLFAAAPSGRLVMGNRRVEEILGHPIIESPNIDAYDLWIGFHPDGRRVQGHEWPLARAVQGETIRGEDYLYQRGDGRKVWIRIHGAPVREESGEIAGGIVALYDIDEQRRMQDENARLYQEAWAANRAKDDFLAMLSHELRTPMTAVIGWARILRDEATDNPIVREAAEAIGSSAQLQAQLVDDLLDVSRIANGKITLDRKPVDVNEVIAEAITAASIAAETHGVRLVPALGSVAIVDADRGRLRQVIGNLLSNAIKFTPKGGLVEIRSAQSESWVEVRVCDTGRGIAPRLLPHIFERLRQASDGEAGGLGLGLTIVKRLTELHDGDVHAESEGEGKGATFVVRLPSFRVTV